MASKRMTKKRRVTKRRGGGKRYKRNKITRKRHYDGGDDNDEKSITNFYLNYSNKIKKFNTHFTDIDKEKNIILSFINPKTSDWYKSLFNTEINSLFNTSGGGEITYNYNSGILTSKKLSETEFEFNNYTKPTNYNVLIIGAGPIGLFMAILLKIYIPNLDINIIEKRNSNGNQKITRKLSRQNIIRNQSNFYYDTFLTNFDTFKTELTKIFNKVGINSELHIQDQDKFFSLYPLLDKIESKIEIKDELKDFMNKYNNKKNPTLQLPLNIIEFYLSQFAQTLNISIVYDDMNNIKNIEKFLDEKTLSIFDATGGRLIKPEWSNINDTYKLGKNPRNCIYIAGDEDNLNIDDNKKKELQQFQNNINLNKPNPYSEEYFSENNYGFYYLKCSKNITESPEIDDNMVKNPSLIKKEAFPYGVKGYNNNNLNTYPFNNVNIPLIGIGDSLRTVDLMTGLGLNNAMFHSFICALLFKYNYRHFIDTKSE